MAAHDLFSRYVGIPLADFQRAVRPSERSRYVSKRHALQFRIRTRNWTQSEKERWILQQLRRVVRDAARGTAYYASLFKRMGFNPELEFGFDEFARIPILDKDDIAKAGYDLVNRNIPANELRPDATGGSTGEPVRIWVGPKESGWRESSQLFCFREMGIARGSRMANLWGHHLDPVGVDSLWQRTSNFLNNLKWFDCFRLGPDVLLQYHEQMEAFQPDCIVAYASALAAFAEFLSQRGIQPSYPRNCIVTGAEKLYDSQREVAERVFRKPVYERYGSRDVGGMAFQLPGNKDYYVDWSNILLEPEFAQSESSILVTKLHADGMPMIRFRIGDVAAFPSDSRSGHPTFHLHTILGRAVDKIWLRDGHFINSILFPHMMKDFPVHQFMVLQDEDYSVEVQIVPGTNFSEESRSWILATIQKNLPGLPIEVTVVDEIKKSQANKWRPVITRVVPPVIVPPGASHVR
jgi:phenylacetate-CoA ligase